MINYVQRYGKVFASVRDSKGGGNISSSRAGVFSPGAVESAVRRAERTDLSTEKNVGEVGTLEPFAFPGPSRLDEHIMSAGERQGVDIHLRDEPGLEGGRIVCVRP